MNKAKIEVRERNFLMIKKTTIGVMKKPTLAVPRNDRPYRVAN